MHMRTCTYEVLLKHVAILASGNELNVLAGVGKARKKMNQVFFSVLLSFSFLRKLKVCVPF